MTSIKTSLFNRVEWRVKETGDLHKLDGPARVYSNGNKEWWFNGKLHRIDGPAIENSDGLIEWCYKGKFFKSKEEWFDALSKDEQIEYLFKIEGSK